MTGAKWDACREAQRMLRILGQGRFRLADVPAGHTALVATAPGHSLTGQYRQLQPGRVANDVKLVLAPPRELRPAVTDEAGRPVAGAVLANLGWKTPRGGLFWLSPKVLRRAEIAARTGDAGGAIVFAGLPLGAVLYGEEKDSP